MNCAFGVLSAVSPSHFTRSETRTTCGVVSSESRMHLPGPIPYAFQTIRPSLLYSILEIKLTPGTFTFREGFWFCNEMLSVTSTPRTPPEDWIASTISSEVLMLEPWLRWTLMCDLSDAAFLSQGPLQP